MSTVVVGSDALNRPATRIDPEEQRDFVVVANRLPVDRSNRDDRTGQWRTSPGGLVSALAPVMRRQAGSWVGWAGSPDNPAETFDHDGMHLVAVSLSDEEVRDYYEGFCNATLWPLYHDAIAPPKFERAWWEAYVSVNERFAAAACRQAAAKAAVWVHDYQLQLVPEMVRRERPDLTVGFFNHIPFPGYEIFAQLPWRRQIVEGLLGADLIGFQRAADATNFLRACRRSAKCQTRGGTVSVTGNAGRRGRRHDRATVAETDRPEVRSVRVRAFPISIDYEGYEAVARRPEVQARAKAIRTELGNPRTVLLGVDRLDYSKGILHRLTAYEELLDEGRLAPPDSVLVQVATPSRDRVLQYQVLREQVQRQVGRVNGNHATLGQPAVTYLNQGLPREEMAALYLAADVMLVTPLRDGMNLVAKEYVTCRHDLGGALVLSEFTGAYHELHQAFVCNPHDIEGLKQTILKAINTPAHDKARIMKALRRRVADHDVDRWATRFLDALAVAPNRPEASIRAHQRHTMARRA